MANEQAHIIGQRTNFAGSDTSKPLTTEAGRTGEDLIFETEADVYRKKANEKAPEIPAQTAEQTTKQTKAEAEFKSTNSSLKQIVRPVVFPLVWPLL